MNDTRFTVVAWNALNERGERLEVSNHSTYSEATNWLLENGYASSGGHQYIKMHTKELLLAEVRPFSTGV
ncbi:hypothetical protein [Kurthia sp. Dielmo]|uniref:hypothetical protein n=1 Tax=Kurthia sp. Dielmo TaxID=1033738 RepID=UPI001121D21B|nr:hypothetical protein [Kurthia sp. Dielmo]